jgi:hypothetical protein
VHHKVMWVLQVVPNNRIKRKGTWVVRHKVMWVSQAVPYNRDKQQARPWYIHHQVYEGTAGCSIFQGQAKSEQLGYTSRGYVGVTAGGSKLQREAKSEQLGYTSQGYVGTTGCSKGKWKAGTWVTREAVTWDVHHEVMWGCTGGSEFQGQAKSKQLGFASRGRGCWCPERQWVWMNACPPTPPAHMGPCRITWVHVPSHRPLPHHMRHPSCNMFPSSLSPSHPSWTHNTSSHCNLARRIVFWVNKQE